MCVCVCVCVFVVVYFCGNKMTFSKRCDVRMLTCGRILSDTRVVQFKMTLGLPFENEATHRKMFIPNTTLKFT